MKTSPIAVFAYNRPHHLEVCLEAISLSWDQESPIYIFCDAAKCTKHAEGVEKTRAVARSWGKAHVIEREYNFRFRNITEGISQLCEKFGRCIIIEDDVVISPDFLPYMQQALDFYEEKERVFGVSGFMYSDPLPEVPQSVLLPYPLIWGWATWKRAWDHFVFEPEDWEAYLKNRRRRHHFDCFGSMKFSKMVRLTMRGACEAWGPQWFYAVHKNQGLFVNPHQSLVWNSGCGGGTHGDTAKDADLSLGDEEFYIHGGLCLEDFKKPRLKTPFTFPTKIEPNQTAMRHLAINFHKHSLTFEKRKRFRLRSKLLYQKLALFCSRSASRG